jgi:hypothetical protein
MQRLSTSRSYQLFVGIDLSAATFTVSWMAPTGRPSRPITIEQTAQGYTFLQLQLCTSGISPHRLFWSSWKPPAPTGLPLRPPSPRQALPCV